MRRQENELLDSGLAHLESAGLRIIEVSPDEGDPVLQLRLADRKWLYEAHLRSRISAASAPTPPPAAGRHILLVAPHVSDKVADLLRQRNVQYVDSVGNMYLREDGLLLDVRGRRGPATPRPGTPGRPLRAFKPSGLKVVFALLADPDLITATYREIGHVSGVSLGTVQWVLKELEGAGYTTTAPRRLYQTRRLLDRWVEAYAFDLWPRLTLARFDAADPAWWATADDALRAAGAEWGGETAAHRLNPHLRPKRAVLYAPAVPKTLALENRFRKSDGEGGVEVRERFWHLPPGPILTVPTPLIYADLLASADPRLAEAAAHLRENDALLQRLDRS